MPERKSSGGRSPEDRTPAQRDADHANLALLSDTLVPALVEKLAASGLGELEVREGPWRIRLRRPPAAAPVRRGDRTWAMPHTDRDGRTGRDGMPGATSMSGGSRAEHRLEPRTELRADDSYVADDPPRSIAASPTVGIFRPEVMVGTAVQAGDRVGVVDLLGIPQDVPSPIDGTLVEVFPSSGEAVEYGEPIAAVEADPPPTALAAGDPDVNDASVAADASSGADPVASEASGAAPAGEDRG